MKLNFQSTILLWKLSEISKLTEAEYIQFIFRQMMEAVCF